MEKSIESIWKEGFLKDDALVAPKVNDLYNQKSIHLLDDFKNRYQWNYKFLVIFSFIVLLISFPIGMQYMGVPLFFILNGLVIISKKHLETLQHIDKNKNSYEYLKSYDRWLKKRISLISKVYAVAYPLLFLSVVLGFWFLDLRDYGYLGELVVRWIMKEFPNTILIGGVPWFGILLVMLLMGVVSFYSGKIYQYDFNSIYGKLMKKLEELISDMEELNLGKVN